MFYTPTEDWVIGFIPSVGWSYENGASANDALEYGAVVTASKVFSPRLTLGLGAAVFHQIYETKVFPFPVIDWQIDDHWKLMNPSRRDPPVGPVSNSTMPSTIAGRWASGDPTARTCFA